MAEGRKTLVLQEVEPVTVEKEEVQVSEEEQVTIPKWRMAARFVVGCGLRLLLCMRLETDPKPLQAELLES